MEAVMVIFSFLVVMPLSFWWMWKRQTKYFISKGHKPFISSGGAFVQGVFFSILVTFLCTGLSVAVFGDKTTASTTDQQAQAQLQAVRDAAAKREAALTPEQREERRLNALLAQQKAEAEAAKQAELAKQEAEKQAALAKAEAEKQAKESEIKVLSFTVDEYVERFNHAMEAMGDDKRLTLMEEKPADKFLMLQALLNNNIGLLIQGSPVDRKFSSVIMMAKGDGSIGSGVDMVFSIAASVMAIENPDMPAKERGKLLKQFGLLNGKFIKTNHSKVTRNSINYDLSRSDLTGIWLTMEIQ
jgi:hypothetical protein